MKRTIEVKTSTGSIVVKIAVDSDKSPMGPLTSNEMEWACARLADAAMELVRDARGFGLGEPLSKLIVK